MRGARGEPDATASASTHRRIASSTRVRVCSSYVRTLSSTVAASGMMFGPVPAAILPTVTTAGVVAAISRDTIVCRRTTHMAASTTGSTVACGMDPCPPRPNSVMRKLSAADRTDPSRTPTYPAGYGQDVLRGRPGAARPYPHPITALWIRIRR